MIKDIFIFISISLLLFVLGEVFISPMAFGTNPASYYLFGFLLFLFIKCHVITLGISKWKKDVPLGFVFLGFLVYQLIFSSCYFILLSKKTTFYDKPFILQFMAAYFILLFVNVWLIKNRLNQV